MTDQLTRSDQSIDWLANPSLARGKERLVSSGACWVCGLVEWKGGPSRPGGMVPCIVLKEAEVYKWLSRRNVFGCGDRYDRWVH